MGNHKDSSAIWNIHEAQLPLYYKQPFWNRRIQSVPIFIWPAFVEKREKKQVFTSHFVNETDWGPLHMSPVDQAGSVSFLRKTKKTLHFPVCCRLLKCPTPLHFLPSLVPVSFFFNCSIFGPLYLSFSDLLAALYNLCFFLHSLLWALLNQGKLQRLDEILMEIFLSIVDLMLLQLIPFMVYLCFCQIWHVKVSKRHHIIFHLVND